MKKVTSLFVLLCIILISPAIARPATRINPRATAKTPLPVLEEEIVVRDWHVIGPFLSGPREPLANPLAGEFHPLDSSGIPNLNATYPSTLESGRDVGWTEVEADEKGNLNIKFENVDWDKINDEWGVSGIYYTGAAYAKFQTDKKCQALANAHRIGSFILNGVRYSGDPYGHRLIKAPVILEEGENHILFFFGGFGGQKSVSFKLEPVPSEVMILDRDILLPDVVRDEKLEALVGVPVLNTTDVWLNNVKVSLEGESMSSNKFNIYKLAPLSVIKVPVKLSIPDGFPSDWEEDKVEVKITVEHRFGQTEEFAKARVRNPEDSRIITFQSYIDKSAQKLAVRYPIDYDPDKEYALILSLHGAGVRCEGQVDAYQSKDWAFVVAPTNRRRFGFDWQDWGRLDTLEVLKYCKKQFPIDINRIYLVGHSMGGHGAWHVGCTHADQFAAIAPSAGWASFQLYIPWFLRRNELFSDPDCKRIFDATLAPDRTELLLPNLRNTPILAAHGAEDDDVPPTHARLLTGMLDRMGYQAAYWEEPGQGHWWDASPDVPGADCVDHDRIMNFLKSNVREPYPKHVTFVSYDLGNVSQRYWVKVFEAIKPMGKVYVDAEIVSDTLILCTTSNVRHLSLDLKGYFPTGAPRTIEIDGQIVEIPTDHEGSVELKDGEGRWRLKPFSQRAMMKQERITGPIKRAFYRPFIIVAGSKGSSEENTLNLEIARNLAQRWWYRANGYVRVVLDRELIVYDLGIQNLILIGGPQSNSISASVAKHFPIQIGKGGVWLGGEFIPGDDLAVKFIYPNRACMEDNIFKEGWGYGNNLILCNWGTSLEGMRLAGGLTCLYSGSGLPDFLIYDKEVKLKGYAGVRAAGFFDNDWQLDPELYYISRN